MKEKPKFKGIYLKLTPAEKDKLAVEKQIFKMFYGVDRLSWEEYFASISEQMHQRIWQLKDKGGEDGQKD